MLILYNILVNYPIKEKINYVINFLKCPFEKDICSSSEHILRYFDEIWEFYYPDLDSKATTTFKAQKGSEDIIKIVHVTSVIKKKEKTLFNNFFSCISVLDSRTWYYMVNN